MSRVPENGRPRRRPIPHASPRAREPAHSGAVDGAILRAHFRPSPPLFPSAEPFVKTLRALLLALTLGAILPPRATAQAQAVMASVGDRIRLSRSGARPRPARLLAQTSDSITVQWMNGSREQIPLFEVGGLEVSRGRRHYLIRGAVGGLVVGAGFGLLLKNIREQELGYEAYGSKPRRRANLFPIAVASGTALGALVGTMGTERWLPASVSASRTRVGISTPSEHGGIGLVVSGSW